MHLLVMRWPDGCCAIDGSRPPYRLPKMTVLSPMLLTYVLQADPEMRATWREVWDAIAGTDQDQLLTRAVSLAVLLIGAVATRVAHDRTEAAPRERPFWSVAASLRVPTTDLTAWMRATGRVPLEHVHEGSVYSKFWSRFDGLVMRPSAAKPAFAIRQVREIPNEEPACGTEVPPHGGFRIRVWLQPGEHRRHLLKSMRAPAFRQSRSLAFCKPHELADPEAPVVCIAVKTARRHVKYDGDRSGQYIEFESADPLLSDFGSRETFCRKAVPPKTIWMLNLDSSVEPEPETLLRRDPRPPSGGRIWRLIVWPRWVVIPSAVVACYLSLPWALTKLFGVDSELLADLASLAWIAIRYEVLFIVTMDVVFAAMHAAIRCLVENRWGQDWLAGTTGCVEDGRRLRNGILR